MTVRELIEALLQIPEEKQDFKIILAKDAEGNGFSPFEDFSEAEYVPETTWSGDIISFDGEETTVIEPNSIVFWPVN